MFVLIEREHRIAMLLDRGADPKLRDNEGKLPADYADKNTALNLRHVLHTVEGHFLMKKPYQPCAALLVMADCSD